MKHNETARDVMLKEELARWEGEVARLRPLLANAEARASYYSTQVGNRVKPIWTPQEDEELLALRARHIPYALIAKRMGRSYSAVTCRWTTLTRNDRMSFASMMEAAE